MLFVKYLSDTYKEKIEEYTKRYNGDQERIKRAMSRERFILEMNPRRLITSTANGTILKLA